MGLDITHDNLSLKVGAKESPEQKIRSRYEEILKKILSRFNRNEIAQNDIFIKNFEKEAKGSSRGEIKEAEKRISYFDIDSGDNYQNLLDDVGKQRKYLLNQITAWELMKDEYIDLESKEIINSNIKQLLLDLNELEGRVIENRERVKEVVTDSIWNRSELAQDLLGFFDDKKLKKEYRDLEKNRGMVLSKVYRELFHEELIKIISDSDNFQQKIKLKDLVANSKNKDLLKNVIYNSLESDLINYFYDKFKRRDSKILLMKCGYKNALYKYLREVKGIKRPEDVKPEEFLDSKNILNFRKDYLNVWNDDDLLELMIGVDADKYGKEVKEIFGGGELYMVYEKLFGKVSFKDNFDEITHFIKFETDSSQADFDYEVDSTTGEVLRDADGTKKIKMQKEKKYDSGLLSNSQIRKIVYPFNKKIKEYIGNIIKEDTKDKFDRDEFVKFMRDKILRGFDKGKGLNESVDKWMLDNSEKTLDDLSVKNLFAVILRRGLLIYNLRKLELINSINENELENYLGLVDKKYKNVFKGKLKDCIHKNINFDGQYLEDLYKRVGFLLFGNGEKGIKIFDSSEKLDHKKIDAFMGVVVKKVGKVKPFDVKKEFENIVVELEMGVNSKVIYEDIEKKFGYSYEYDKANEVLTVFYNMPLQITMSHSLARENRMPGRLSKDERLLKKQMNVFGMGGVLVALSCNDTNSNFQKIIKDQNQKRWLRDGMKKDILFDFFEQNGENEEQVAGREYYQYQKDIIDYFMINIENSSLKKNKFITFEDKKELKEKLIELLIFESVAGTNFQDLEDRIKMDGKGWILQDACVQAIKDMNVWDDYLEKYKDKITGKVDYGFVFSYFKILIVDRSKRVKRFFEYVNNSAEKAQCSDLDIWDKYKMIRKKIQYLNKFFKDTKGGSKEFWLFLAGRDRWNIKSQELIDDGYFGSKFPSRNDPYREFEEVNIPISNIHDLLFRDMKKNVPEKIENFIKKYQELMQDKANSKKNVFELFNVMPHELYGCRIRYVAFKNLLSEDGGFVGVIER